MRNIIFHWLPLRSGITLMVARKKCVNNICTFSQAFNSQQFYHKKQRTVHFLLGGTWLHEMSLYIVMLHVVVLNLAFCVCGSIL
jgi:hypothetical protein